MEKRPFGRTGHMSTVAVFGAAALWEVSQEEADAVMEDVIAAGVNHIDVAPSYGIAEKRLGPWMKRVREDFFLGCKTMERTREGAAVEMQKSMERLQVDYFDLYQIHAITTMDELDQATRPGGALEAIVDAREKGLTQFIGITGHGVDSPALHLEALRRYDFDSVLFPINFVLYANPTYRKNTQDLLKECLSRDVGSMIIKSIAKGPWGERPKTHTTWYEPLTTKTDIQRAINFALSQDVSGICTVGDIALLPLVLEACEQFLPMSLAEQEAMIAAAGVYEPLFS